MPDVLGLPPLTACSSLSKASDADTSERTGTSATGGGSSFLASLHAAAAPNLELLDASSQPLPLLETTSPTVGPSELPSELSESVVLDSSEANYDASKISIRLSLKYGYGASANLFPDRPLLCHVLESYPRACRSLTTEFLTEHQSASAPVSFLCNTMKNFRDKICLASLEGLEHKSYEVWAYKSLSIDDYDCAKNGGLWLPAMRFLTQACAALELSHMSNRIPHASSSLYVLVCEERRYSFGGEFKSNGPATSAASRQIPTSDIRKSS